MQKLPIELLKGIDSPSASIREIIAEELAQMLHSSDGANRTVAYGALQKLCDDDSRRVSKIARESIASFEGKEAEAPVETQAKKSVDTSMVKPKAKYATTAFRIYGLVGILIALMGSFLYFQSPLLKGDSSELTEVEEPLALAKQEMLELKTNAQELGAELYAEETYLRALEAEKRGNQKLLAGDAFSAKISYDFAKGLFNKSLEEALANDNIKVEDKEEENLLEISALGAKSDMELAQSAAKKARADRVVKKSYKRAVEASERAEQAFAEGDFFEAASAYDSARNLYRKASNEAKRKALAAETNLSKIKKVVETARKEMLAEKVKAENGGGKDKALKLFKDAESKQAAGDAKFKVANKKNYLAAQNFYSDAKEGYKQVNIQLEKLFFIPKLVDDASLARTEMNNAKQKVKGTQTDKNKLNAYQLASQKENKGESEFKAKRYKAAQNSFEEAKALFLQAEAELLAVKSKTKPSQEELQNEGAEKKHTAQQEIQNLIGQYKNGLENGDVNQLVPFISKKEQKTWSNFFNTITDLKVSIQNENIQVDQDEAKANFMVVMSYFNKSTNKTITNSIPKDWKLSDKEGKWSLSSK